MVILSIDPSIVKLWVSVFDNSKLVFFWTFKTKTEGETRLLEIANFIEWIFTQYSPDYLIIESQYFGRFISSTTFRISEVKGLVMWLFLKYSKNWIIQEVTPSQYRKVIWIKAKKREEIKKESIKYISDVLKIEKKVDDNTADAILMWIYWTKVLK